MPNHKTHLFGGVLIFIVALVGCSAAAFLVEPYYLPTLLGLCLLGALFPDIDTESKIRHFWLAGTLLGACLCWWLTLPGAAGLLVTIGVIPLVLPHRGLLHHLWFLACITIAITYGAIQLLPQAHTAIALHGAFFFIGALSHVLMDRVQSWAKRR
jgi:membrane-bound metal-dependent hydrolase YbcI (DUF457 family)